MQPLAQRPVATWTIAIPLGALVGLLGLAKIMGPVASATANKANHGKNLAAPVTASSTNHPAKPVNK